MAYLTPSQGKYKISRRGRKLQVSDDQRTLIALPKDVPERTWAEILQKEENELLVFDIREEILEEAFEVVYEQYMERQSTLFIVKCAAEAWLKLIDWHFYRHDPGEETSAHPPCWIPKREESWIPDERPDPSPKDTWSKHNLHVVEDTPAVLLEKWPSSSSLDMPVVEEIPSEYWFPGKINVPSFMKRVKKSDDEQDGALDMQDSGSGTRILSEDFHTESEVLQKVTDYSTEGLSDKDSSSSYGELKNTTPVDGEVVQGPLFGAGDSTVAIRPKKRYGEKSKSSFLKPGFLPKIGAFSKSKGALPSLDIGDSRSRISVISDCRLRNLRLETQYEITSEKMDTPPGEHVKRK